MALTYHEHVKYLQPPYKLKIDKSYPEYTQWYIYAKCYAVGMKINCFNNEFEQIY